MCFILFWQPCGGILKEYRNLQLKNLDSQTKTLFVMMCNWFCAFNNTWGSVKAVEASYPGELPCNELQVSNFKRCVQKHQLGTAGNDLYSVMLQTHLEEVGKRFITLSAHAQRWYGSWVCVSVCYSTSHFSSVCSSHKRYDLFNGQWRSDVCVVFSETAPLQS